MGVSFPHDLQRQHHAWVLDDHKTPVHFWQYYCYLCSHLRCIRAVSTTWCSQHHRCWIFCLHLPETPVFARGVCFTPSAWPRAERTMDCNFTNCNPQLSGLCCAESHRGAGAHTAMPSSTLTLLQPRTLGPKWLLIKEQDPKSSRTQTSSLLLTRFTQTAGSQHNTWKLSPVSRFAITKLNPARSAVAYLTFKPSITPRFMPSQSLRKMPTCVFCCARLSHDK